MTLPQYNYDLYYPEVFTPENRCKVGMQDCNGAEIRDGDIIRFGEKIMLVYYNPECFQWQAREDIYTYMSFDSYKPTRDWNYIDFGWIYAEIPILGSTSTEVLGNIFENPELLNWETEPDESWLYF